MQTVNWHVCQKKRPIPKDLGASLNYSLVHSDPLSAVVHLCRQFQCAKLQSNRCRTSHVTCASPACEAGIQHCVKVR